MPGMCRCNRCASPSARLATPPLLCLQVAAFQCLQPFIGTLLAFLVLNESPTPWDLGAVRMLSVVWLLLIAVCNWAKRCRRALLRLLWTHAVAKQGCLSGCCPAYHSQHSSKLALTCCGLRSN